jgi:hypothetical protein
MIFEDWRGWEQKFSSLSVNALGAVYSRVPRLPSSSLSRPQNRLGRFRTGDLCQRRRGTTFPPLFSTRMRPINVESAVRAWARSKS